MSVVKSENRILRVICLRGEIASAHARARLFGESRENGFELRALCGVLREGGLLADALGAAFEHEFGIIEPPRLAVEFGSQVLELRL